MKRKKYFEKRDGLLGFDWSVDWKQKPTVTDLLKQTKKKIRRVYANFQLFR